MAEFSANTILTEKYWQGITGKRSNGAKPKVKVMTVRKVDIQQKFRVVEKESSGSHDNPLRRVIDTTLKCGSEDSTSNTKSMLCEGSKWIG